MEMSREEQEANFYKRERLEGESFEDYKRRRKVIKFAIKLHSYGKKKTTK